ncbi:hypothetical protein CDL12_20614 [Handroanthus impetiginosus]|uniref:Pectinesterase inhibitor domain-containing protein n=1 Tax=Handroanthus impetiginosus TaxID=429701 RepID=A0A2G9GNF0_9LAMI|nr:hypothetical protein CDL12_20614 [Handroanthus impetiginosus]
MTKMSLVNSFLFFLVLLTISSPINSSDNYEIIINPIITKAPPVVIVTDTVIHKICPRTQDPNLCRYILNQFKGKPLFPEPLARIIGIAQNHAQKTAKKIWSLYDSIKDNKSELKLSYNKCLKNYTNAMNLLREAYGFMRAGKASAVKNYSSLAMAEVHSCDEELAKYQYEPSNLYKDNKELNKVGSIIYAICGKLSPGK